MGYLTAARNPIRHLVWVQVGIARGVLEFVLGAVWLVSRVWYAMAYQQDAAKRGPAFGLSMLVFAVLTLGGQRRRKSSVSVGCGDRAAFRRDPLCRG